MLNILYNGRKTIVVVVWSVAYLLPKFHEKSFTHFGVILTKQTNTGWNITASHLWQRSSYGSSKANWPAVSWVWKDSSAELRVPVCSILSCHYDLHGCCCQLLLQLMRWALYTCINDDKMMPETGVLTHANKARKHRAGVKLWSVGQICVRV